MNKFWTNLKRQAEENPVVVLGVAAALLTGAAKVMDANNNRSNSKTYALETQRRIMNNMR
jgi:hypothetical protein